LFLNGYGQLTYAHFFPKKLLKNIQSVAFMLPFFTNQKNELTTWTEGISTSFSVLVTQGRKLFYSRVLAIGRGSF
jgi:hypothetical protein